MSPMLDRLPAQERPRKGFHQGGRGGGVKSTRPKLKFERGRPKEITLSPPERYWIQAKIERIPYDSRTELEHKLLAKVQL